MWFTRLAISRPILIWMALAAITLLGVQAYFRLPAELNPRVDIPVLMVTTLYPGAGPPEIETQVSKPLEEAVGTVGGVRNVFSSSQASVSILSLDFQVGTNLETAMNEVRGRVEAIQANLPKGVLPPVVAKLDINAQPILHLGTECSSLSSQQLRALIDSTVRPQVERVPGVATVRVLGGEQREIKVEVDGQKLAQFGLTIADVVNSLKASGKDIPAGGITQGKRETDVRLAGGFRTLDSIRNTEILAPMPGAFNPNSLPSPPLTVADVASVQDGMVEHTELNRINGRDGVSLIFTKASDANTVTVVQEIANVLKQIRPTLPSDLKIVTLRDEAGIVQAALEDVNTSLVLGAILAMGVILLFLHNLRGTFIVSLAIPACIVATFLVMWAAHFTLNQMTLLALSLSVGILVDDSIVVLESITRHLQEGEKPREAALNGRTEIGFADITTTLVDVVVFVPIAFMGGIVGGFFKQFGLTIATATLFSLVISFSVTPMLASRWYREGEDMETKQGIFAPLEKLYRRLEAQYKRLIRWALGHRSWVLGLSLLSLVAITLASIWRLGFEFTPGFDKGQITIAIEMPPGTALSATDAATHEIEKAIAQKSTVLSTATNVGQILGGFGSIPQQGAQFAQINLRLIPKRSLLSWRKDGTRTQTDEEITWQLRKTLEPIAKQVGGRITATAQRAIEGVQLPIAIELRGQDVKRLTRFAEQVRDLAAQIPGVLDPDVSVRDGKPEVRAEIDPSRASQLHIPTAQAGSILRDSVTGNTETVFRENGKEYPIRVQLAGIQRDDPQNIQNVVVGSEAPGSPILLADIADIKTRVGPTSIERSNGQRLVTVTAKLAANAPLGNVRAVLERKIRAIPKENIDIHWGGEAETLDENVVPFASALIMAVLLVYIVMASLFNNLGTPFVIMFTLPMALVGALGALVLTGETLSLVSAIGIIMLTGLMGRNAILLLDYTNTLRKRGQERNAAIIEAGATRLRPILMTTTATIVGMLPVALRIGEASETRAPMAIVVIGGLVVSTVLTLVVIPVLYSIFDDLFPHHS